MDLSAPIDPILKTLLYTYFDVMYNVEILDNLIKIESLSISPSPIKKILIRI